MAHSVAPRVPGGSSAQCRRSAQGPLAHASERTCWRPLPATKVTANASPIATRMPEWAASEDWRRPPSHHAKPAAASAATPNDLLTGQG